MRQEIFRKLAILIVCITFFAVLGCRRNNDDGRLRIVIYYADNATLPFRHNWLTVRTIEEMFNVRIEWEVFPIADYRTKVSIALNTGINTPDVILFQSIAGENIPLAMNGAIVPISEYAEWTPHWNSWVEKFGLQYEVDALRLLSGRRYNLPSLTDVPFYDAGLILREDILELYGFPPPRTFEDLYQILRAYKDDNPASFPLTMLVGPRVHYRMTQPSWGISLHLNGACGSRVLSWDYEERVYFAGAISERYREYMRFWNRLFSAGLLDPEMAEPISGEVWTRKLATGSAIATFAFYDQIGGVTAASSIPGFRLNLFPPLEGPVGAHHQPRNRTGPGIIFPIATSRRPDFEQVVRMVDKMFFSPEAVRVWTFGVEGITYTMDGDDIVFSDSILESPDGVFKVMQLRYGAGVTVTQMVWVKEQELTKYTENFAEINRRVMEMPNAIQYVPPAPRFSALDGERAAALIGPLFNTFLIWDDAFLTGARCLDADWDAYVREMKARGILELLELYNNNIGL